MLKFLRKTLLFSVLLCLPVWAVPNPAVAKAHKATHKIKMYAVGVGTIGSCSATAIGPHAILTAAHCNSISAVINVDGKDAEVMGITNDGLDHSIILLRGVDFADFADVAVDEKLQQSDKVFLFGNPDGIPDVYREGYVAAFNKPDDAPETAAELLMRPRTPSGNDAVKMTYYDFNGFFGDSGSALFDEKGDIAAITSFIFGDNVSGMSFKFMGSYEMRLSKEQFAQARAYVPPARPKEAPEKKKKSFFDLFE